MRPRSRRARGGMIGWGTLAWGLLAAAAAAQEPDGGPRPGGCPPIGSMDQLLRLGPQQLDALYQGAAVGAIPEGRARGQAIFAPGTRLTRPLAKAARVLWQGKVFRGADASAVNRFFGVKVIRANVFYGPSWSDGRPAIILDYQDTSRLYAPYRDELREVAPGLFLGLMYARTAPQPTLKMYFALETRPCRP